MGEITLEELQLAARNHGMPLETLREAVTPVGLHYLLIHYDIPQVDAASWALTVDGRVERELKLGLDDLRARPVAEVVATMECAGNGRAKLEPRPVSQPWLLEAVGTGRWRGTPLAALLEEAGVGDGAVEVLFTALDRGIENDEEQWFQRSLPLAEARRSEVLLAYDLNGAPLPPQHGFPLRLLVPGWYGMTNVKWLSRITVLDEPFDGYQQAQGYRLRQAADEPGVPLQRIYPRALLVPPGIPDFMSRERTVERGVAHDHGPGLVGPCARRVGRGERRRRCDLGACRARRRLARRVGVARLQLPVGGDRPGPPDALLPGTRRSRQRAAGRDAVERGRLREQRRAARRRERPLAAAARSSWPNV